METASPPRETEGPSSATAVTLAARLLRDCSTRIQMTLAKYNASRTPLLPTEFWDSPPEHPYCPPPNAVTDPALHVRVHEVSRQT